ncbi:MAG: TonB-dependent receptor [Nitrospiria bacterium]
MCNFRIEWRKKAFLVFILLITWIIRGTVVPTKVEAGGIQTLEEVNVTESTEDLVGTANSATEGNVTQEQIQERPKLRPGEMFEEVPGLIVTQHSGEGKANQYFLRGFNLDHGTDLKTTIDDMPVNMPTHAHGQGYTDLNFVIPELVQSLQYKKGIYYATEGDFSSAGAVNMVWAHSLDKGINEVTYGSYGYRRLLSAASTNLGSGTLLYGAEANLNDGPWDVPDNFGKFNGNLRYTQGNWSVMAMGYEGRWTATDQVPQEAIDNGLIDRFGTLDPTDGGVSKRYSVSTNYDEKGGNGESKFNAYWINYSLDLYSNFDFNQLCNVPQISSSLASHPGASCDQMEQYDNREIYGGGGSRTWLSKVFGLDMDNTFGTQIRYDDVHLALNRTIQRQVWLSSADDIVKEGTIGVYIQNGTRWNDWFRSQIGLRGDLYNVNDQILLFNQGTNSVTSGIMSPKLALIFGPWDKTEFYVNAGMGFHSNDGRGIGNRIDQNPYNDPSVTGDPSTSMLQSHAPVTLLVRTKGAEVGSRTAIIPHLQSEITLWWLDVDSELTFDGDHGDTTASAPTRRIGVEWANYYTPSKFVTFDADFAYTDAHYREEQPGTDIENSLPVVISGGITVHHLDGPFGSLRVRYFSAGPLVPDGSFTAPPSTTVDMQLGYEFTKQFKLSCDLLNLLNAQNWDVMYAYPVQIANPGPGNLPNTNVNSYVGKPSEPFEARVSLIYSF